MNQNGTKANRKYVERWDAVPAQKCCDGEDIVESHATKTFRTVTYSPRLISKA